MRTSSTYESLREHHPLHCGLLQVMVYLEKTLAMPKYRARVLEYLSELMVQYLRVSIREEYPGELLEQWRAAIYDTTRTSIPIIRGEANYGVNDLVSLCHRPLSPNTRDHVPRLMREVLRVVFSDPLCVSYGDDIVIPDNALASLFTTTQPIPLKWGDSDMVLALGEFLARADCLNMAYGRRREQWLWDMREWLKTQRVPKLLHQPEFHPPTKRVEYVRQIYAMLLIAIQTHAVTEEWLIIYRRLLTEYDQNV